MLPHRFTDMFETVSIIDVLTFVQFGERWNFRDKRRFCHTLPRSHNMCIYQSKMVEIFFTCFYLRGYRLVKQLVSYWASCG